MTGRRSWTARDFQVIEELAALGLPATVIGACLDPPASRSQCCDAARTAKIKMLVGPGRPSAEDRERWDRIRRRWLSREQVEARERAELQEHAELLGYRITIHGKI